MDNPKLHWMTEKQKTRASEKEMFSNYFFLYERTAKIIKNEAEQHGARVMVGGPGLGQYQMIYNAPPDKKNWYLKFIEECTGKQVPCDFISTHYYGNTGSGKELLTRVEGLKNILNKNQLNIPVWVTEWGASGASNTAAFNVNVSPIAGAFVFAFADAAVRAGAETGMFLCVGSKKAESAAPVLLIGENEKKTDAYHAFQTFQSLDGERISVETDHDSLNGMAFRDGHFVDIVGWNLGWRHQHLWKNIPELRKKAPRNVTLVLRGVKNGAQVETLEMNGSKQTKHLMLKECSGEGEPVFVSSPLDLSFGSYFHIKIKMYEQTGNNFPQS